MRKIDLSKFAHVKSDDKTTTLRHKDGHTLTITHKALSKDMKAQLEALAGSSKTPDQAQEEQKEKKEQKAPVKMAEGGMPEDAAQPPPDFSQMGNINVPTPSGMAVENPQEAPQLPPGGKAQQSMEAELAKLPPLPPEAQQQQQLAATADQKAQDATQGIPGADQTESMLKQGFNQQVAGMTKAAGAQAALADEQAKILDRQMKAQQDAQIAYQQQYKELESERQAHMKDIDEGHIDPDKYWTGDKNGAGGHSRIMASIGMILGGFNPTTQPNAAINLLNHQMDQNLEAQKVNLNSKQNLLAANLRQFGNIKDATEMTRLMQNDLVQRELAKAAAVSANPMAKAAAQQAIGQLQMQAAPMFQQFAMRRAMMNMAGNGGDPQAVDHMLGYMRVMNPEMAKEMQTRYVPGVGMASVAVPETVRTQLIAHKELNQAMSEVMDFAKKHGNSIDPKIRAQGGTMMNNLQDVMRRAVGAGVYKESEAEFMNSMMGDNPAHFFSNFTTMPKVKELQRLKANEFMGLAKGYGLNPQPLPVGPQTKTLKGVTYTRGPDGKAVPVR